VPPVCGNQSRLPFSVDEMWVRRKVFLGQEEAQVHGGVAPGFLHWPSVRPCARGKAYRSPPGRRMENADYRWPAASPAVSTASYPEQHPTNLVRWLEKKYGR
jgi:hypothetical protein